MNLQRTSGTESDPGETNKPPSERATPDIQQIIYELERRLAQLEQDFSVQGTELHRLKRSGLRQKIRNKLRPNLFDFHQYPAREIGIPPGYETETPPEDPYTFAIVTPSLQQAPFIEDTIKSVIEQNYPLVNYHVQDGGSTDSTHDILERYADRISVSSQKDAGQSDAINLGFERVHGDIMGYLNSDDCLMPGALSYVSKFFRDHPEVDVVYSHRIMINHAGQEIGRAILPSHDSEALKWFDPIPQETMFWRKRVWSALGGVDKSFSFAMDWDFILRAQKAGFKFYRLSRFLGCFRVHKEQKTQRMMGQGILEMERLRKTHLGFQPTRHEIEKAMRPYLRRQVFANFLYKL